jgi:hypothetical protein
VALSKRVVRFGVAMGAAALTALAMTLALAGSASGVDAAGGCGATAHIDSQWGSGSSGGQIITVTVGNTSTTTATRWAVAWTLAAYQRVISAWNATVSASGAAATAVNTPYNGTLGPGASTTFGIQLAGTAPTPVLSCTNDAAPTGSGSPGVADVTATAADNGSTLTLHVGQTLGVSLPASYRPPAVTGTALRALSNTGGFPTGQPVAALYRAIAPGTADVSSQTDDPCLHATPPCARPIALFLVHVTILPPSSSGTSHSVTEADNAGTVALRAGDTLVVSLPSMYGPPTVTPSGVLLVLDVTGGYPTGQPLVARYSAVTPGQVDLSTISDAACLHQPMPCPSPQVPWRIHVTVTA